MKHFTPLQILSLSILSVIAIVMAIFAFGTSRKLAPLNANASPEIIYMALATPSPAQISMAEESPDAFDVAERPTAPAGAAVTSTAKPTSACATLLNGVIFVLTVGGKNIDVANGVEESTLKNAPGWLATSAAPGQEGVCVVYGHRNRNHLKMLEKVNCGDTITVTDQAGTQYVYEIESIEILNSDAELRVPTLDGKYLMLVTCYPFRYSGHAPQKYIVLARAQHGKWQA